MPQAHTVFYMAVMAFSTVLVNGSTTKALLGALGMLDKTPAQAQVIDHVVEVRGGDGVGGACNWACLTCACPAIAFTDGAL